jgi:hypothetical protein
LLLILPIIGVNWSATSFNKWMHIFYRSHLFHSTAFLHARIFPAEGYVVSSDKTVKKEFVISNGEKIISSIVVRATTEAALLLARECSVLERVGTIEAREIQPSLRK